MGRQRFNLHRGRLAAQVLPTQRKLLARLQALAMRPTQVWQLGIQSWAVRPKWAEAQDRQRQRLKMHKVRWGACHLRIKQSPQLQLNKHQ